MSVTNTSACPAKGGRWVDRRVYAQGTLLARQMVERILLLCVVRCSGRRQDSNGQPPDRAGVLFSVKHRRSFGEGPGPSAARAHKPQVCPLAHEVNRDADECHDKPDHEEPGGSVDPQDANTIEFAAWAARDAGCVLPRCAGEADRQGETQCD